MFSPQYRVPLCVVKKDYIFTPEGVASLHVCPPPCALFFVLYFLTLLLRNSPGHKARNNCQSRRGALSGVAVAKGASG